MENHCHTALVSESVGNLVKMQILIQQVCVGPEALHVYQEPG